MDLVSLKTATPEHNCEWWNRTNWWTWVTCSSEPVSLQTPSAAPTPPPVFWWLSACRQQGVINTTWRLIERNGRTECFFFLFCFQVCVVEFTELLTPWPLRDASTSLWNGDLNISSDPEITIHSGNVDQVCVCVSMVVWTRLLVVPHTVQ